MNRDDLVRKIASKYSVGIGDTKLWVDAMIDVMSESILNGNDIKIRNFGNFEFHKMKPKIGRDLNTNTEVFVPARMKLYFVPCPRIAEQIKVLPVRDEDIDEEDDST